MVKVSVAEGQSLVATYLTPNAYKWVKTIHLVMVALWLGAACALLGGLSWMKLNPVASPLWVLDTLNVVDWFVLVPGASGVVITGLIFSLKTQWGWGKTYFWIRAKWVIAILGVAVGTFMLAPWLDGLILQAREATAPLALQANQPFIELWFWLAVWGALQILSLLYQAFPDIWIPCYGQNY